MNKHFLFAGSIESCLDLNSDDEESSVTNIHISTVVDLFSFKMFII